jgi:hypothetical protein
MVAGAVTLTGMTQVAEEASAGKKRKVCHCGDVAGGTCTTERVGKKNRKAHLRDHQCDYLGACRSPTACAAAPITIINIDRLGTPCSPSNPCGANSGLECVANVCVPIDLGDACTNNRECSTGRCTGGVCVDCPLLSICGAGRTLQCCTVEASCDQTDDVCVL